MPHLRPFQIQAIDATKRAFLEGLHRVGISLPTGVGKTYIMCRIAEELLGKGRRVLVLVHRDQLVRQTVEALAQWIPREAIGIVQANKDEIDAPVVVASVQTIQNPKRLIRIQHPALTLVDEAHVSVSDSYMRVYEHLDLLPGGEAHAVGFSATWVRTDKRGLGDIWEEIVFRRSIRWAVRNGFLVPPRAIQCGEDVDLDLDHLKVNADGEYADREAAEVVMIEDLRDAAIRSYLRYADGHSVALFAPTQESVRYFLEGFQQAGISCAEYMSGNSKNNRLFAMAGFDNGAIKVLGTCHALAEGWNSPRCAGILLLNPIRSVGRLVQIFGRALRPWPGKHEGLLLDHVRATDDMDLRSVIDLSTTPEGATQEELDEISEVEEAAERQREARLHLVQKTQHTKEIDLFAGTDALWLTTDQGVPFVTTRRSLYFVVPGEDPSAWDVGMYAEGRGSWLARGLPPNEALEYASEEALAEDHTVASKRASWRKGVKKPSEAQLEYARKLGINTLGMSKSEVGDAISIATASRILAPLGRKIIA